MDIEELELELIDRGLEEIEENEGMIYASADYTSFGSFSEAFEKMEMEMKSSKLKRILVTLVKFTDEQLIDIEKMLDKVEEDDDVQEVFTNIA